MFSSRGESKNTAYKKTKEQAHARPREQAFRYTVRHAAQRARVLFEVEGVWGELVDLPCAWPAGAQRPRALGPATPLGAREVGSIILTPQSVRLRHPKVQSPLEQSEGTTGAVLYRVH